MKDEKVLNSTSTKRVIRDCSLGEAIKEATTLLEELNKNAAAQIGERKIEIKEPVKFEIEISERNDGRKSIEIEFEG